MSEPSAVRVSRCPEHGLHGDRPTCFACAGPVERVEMVALDDALTALRSLPKTRFGRLLGGLYAAMLARHLRTPDDEPEPRAYSDGDRGRTTERP